MKSVVAVAVAMVAAFAALSVVGEPKVADTSKVVSLTGRTGAAHGCPVAPWLLVSSAHVFDVAPNDPNFPLVPYRGQNPYWEGEAKGVWASWTADMAFAVPDRDFPTWYEVAKEAPRVGERVWWLGYDWKNPRRAFERKVFNGVVIRTQAGMLIVDEQAIQGSSGSCVLDADSHVVGIIMGTMGMENSESVTVIVGLWGHWFKMPEEADMRMRAEVGR